MMDIFLPYYEGYEPCSSETLVIASRVVRPTTPNLPPLLKIQKRAPTSV